jgi:hypothetical protein
MRFRNAESGPSRTRALKAEEVKEHTEEDTNDSEMADRQPKRQKREDNRNKERLSFSKDDWTLLVQVTKETFQEILQPVPTIPPLPGSLPFPFRSERSSVPDFDQLSEPDFNPQTVKWLRRVGLNDGVDRKDNPACYIRCFRSSGEDVINYLKNYPADYLHVILLLISLGSNDLLYHWPARYLHGNTVLGLNYEAILAALASSMLPEGFAFQELLPRETFRELKARGINRSGILIYGGVTMTQSAQTRYEQDGGKKQPSSRITNFMKGFTGPAEVYEVIAADVPVDMLGELGRILIEKIPLGRCLNSGPGGYTELGGLPEHGGFVEPWLPSVEVYSLRERIDQLELKSSATLEGFVLHPIITSSVLQAARKLARISDTGPVIDPEALKVRSRSPIDSHVHLLTLATLICWPALRRL